MEKRKIRIVGVAVIIAVVLIVIAISVTTKTGRILSILHQNVYAFV